MGLDMALEGAVRFWNEGSMFILFFEGSIRVGEVGFSGNA